MKIIYNYPTMTLEEFMNNNQNYYLEITFNPLKSSKYSVSFRICGYNYSTSTYAYGIGDTEDIAIEDLTSRMSGEVINFRNNDYDEPDLDIKIPILKK